MRKSSGIVRIYCQLNAASFVKETQCGNSIAGYISYLKKVYACMPKYYIINMYSGN